MPICGRCRIGFEPGEVCPKCECPQGTWHRVERDYEFAFLLPVLVIAVIGIGIASWFISLLGFAMIWGGVPVFVEIVVMVLGFVIWAPMVLLWLVFGDLGLPGVFVCLINGVLWVMLLYLMRRMFRRLRIWAAQRRSRRVAARV